MLLSEVPLAQSAQRPAAAAAAAAMRNMGRGRACFPFYRTYGTTAWWHKRPKALDSSPSLSVGCYRELGDEPHTCYNSGFRPTAIFPLVAGLAVPHVVQTWGSLGALGTALWLTEAVVPQRLGPRSYSTDIHPPWWPHCGHSADRRWSVKMAASEAITGRYTVQPQGSYHRGFWHEVVMDAVRPVCAWIDISIHFDARCAVSWQLIPSCKRKVYSSHQGQPRYLPRYFGLIAIGRRRRTEGERRG